MDSTSSLLEKLRSIHASGEFPSGVTVANTLPWTEEYLNAHGDPVWSDHAAVLAFDTYNRHIGIAEYVLAIAFFVAWNWFTSFQMIGILAREGLAKNGIFLLAAPIFFGGSLFMFRDWFDAKIRRTHLALESNRLLLIKTTWFKPHSRLIRREDMQSISLRCAGEDDKEKGEVAVYLQSGELIPLLSAGKSAADILPWLASGLQALYGIPVQENAPDTATKERKTPSGARSAPDAFFHNASIIYPDDNAESPPPKSVDELLGSLPSGLTLHFSGSYGFRTIIKALPAGLGYYTESDSFAVKQVAKKPPVFVTMFFLFWGFLAVAGGFNGAISAISRAIEQPDRILFSLFIVAVCGIFFVVGLIILSIFLFGSRSGKWFVFLPKQLALCSKLFRPKMLALTERKDAAGITPELRHSGENKATLVLKRPDGAEIVLFNDIDAASANWLREAVLSWQKRSS